MSYLSATNLNHSQISLDAGARMRVSQITTLGDYKILGYDRTLLIETSGSGTGTYSLNKYNMTVSSSQWLIRQSKIYHTYASGKSQLIELTFDSFHTQSSIEKRVGYFSSTNVSPFSSSYDGFYLMSSGSQYSIVAERLGVKTLNIPMSQWNGSAAAKAIDWSNFNVILFDFLWLGGAVLRLWVKGSTDFELAHVFNYAGTSQNTFIQSPNQPIRYEIRGTDATNGSFRYICAQAATEGSINESGLSRAVITSASVSMATVGTKYPIKAIRKTGSLRDIPISIDDIAIFVSSSSDFLTWTLEINPTLSAPLTYTSVSQSAVQDATGNGTITVTTPGTIIAAGATATGVIMPTGVLQRNFLSFLAGSLTDSMDQYVLCGTPISPGVIASAYITVKEY